MIRTSEWVSLGHPGKIADYISSYLLDRYIERDPKTRFAVEVMVKDQIVTLGGEIASEADFSDEEITAFVRKAVNEIGYTREYQQKWGRENTICGDEMEVYPLLGKQSPDIGQGVERDAWGDQGIFHGMALDRPSSGNMPRDHYLARKLGQALFRSRLGGLDIKTLVATSDGNASHVTVAIPLRDGDWNDVLVRQKAEGTAKKLVGIEIHDKAIPRAGYPVELEDGTEVGVVTTGYRSISLDRSICFALVKSEYSKLGSPLWIRIRKKVFPGEVVKKRFYQTNYKK